VDAETLDLLDNFNYRSISEISLCPNMWLFYTLQTIQRGNVYRRLTILLITRLSLKWYKFIVIGHELTYFILSSTKNDKIRNTKTWFWLTIWYLQTLLTTKLEFRIDDISVELWENICQQLVLYKKHFLRHILSYKEHTFL
jgi:hypothetical protein